MKRTSQRPRVEAGWVLAVLCSCPCTPPLPLPHPHPHRFDDFYFLTDPEDFVHSHFPDEKEWQLLDTPLSLEDFERGVFKTSAFFSLGLQLIQPRHAHIVTGPTRVLANDRFYRMSAMCSL